MFLILKIAFVFCYLLLNISKCFSSEWEHVRQHKVSGIVPVLDGALLNKHERRNVPSNPEIRQDSCHLEATNATLKSKFDSNVFTVSVSYYFKSFS